MVGVLGADVVGFAGFFAAEVVVFLVLADADDFFVPPPDFFLVSATGKCSSRYNQCINRSVSEILQVLLYYYNIITNFSENSKTYARFSYAIPKESEPESTKGVLRCLQFQRPQSPNRHDIP
jgi:hypothetical protein